MPPNMVRQNEEKSIHVLLDHCGDKPLYDSFVFISLNCRKKYINFTERRWS